MEAEAALAPEQVILMRAILAFAAAVAVWVIREIYLGWKATRDARAKRNNLVRALYAEIDFNTRDMEWFLSKSPGEPQLRDKMTANPSLVPHITDARHTEIYRTRLAELHGVTDPILSRMVHFYGMLEKIKVQIDGVNYPSYQTLSVEGRLNGVMVIVRTSRMAHRYGSELLSQMEQDFPALSLSRFDRGDDGSQPSRIEIRAGKFADPEAVSGESAAVSGTKN
ncbi:hypothetical protein [Roseobacter sp.]|uniref:hypothetical protein n=1 Tax=Roseobacter sp. TaxID=1907202 RepID=UPI0025FC7B9F|nr:hypothetical protein [Roseobacter sp.]